MKTKILSSTLVAALMLTGAAAAADLTAKPSVHHVYLDGQLITPAGYEIEDSNYFKLRDLAAVLSGTGKQFNVSWDEAKASIALTSNQAYTAVGGELAPGDGAVKTAKPSTATVYKDGAALPLTGYEVADNNYYKLRDAAAAFGVEVKWDEATQRVDLITKGDGSAVTPAPENPEKPSETPVDPPANSTEEMVDVKLECVTIGDGWPAPQLANIKVELWQKVAGSSEAPIRVAEGVSDKDGYITFSFKAPKSVYDLAYKVQQFQYYVPEQTVNGIVYAEDTKNFSLLSTTIMRDDGRFSLYVWEK